MMVTRRLSTPSSERAELAEHAEKWSTFILANVLWAVLSIPVVTLPAATVGLFAYMSRRVLGHQPDFFRTFFEGMKQHWRKATVIFCLDLLVGALVLFNVLIFPHMNLTTDPFAFFARSVTLFVAIALLLVNVYVWPLMVLMEKMNIRQLIETSVSLVFSHSLWSLGVLIAALLPVLVSLFLPQGIFVIATASTCVLIICTGTWRVIRHHLSPEQLKGLQPALE